MRTKTMSDRELRRAVPNLGGTTAGEDVAYNSGRHILGLEEFHPELAEEEGRLKLSGLTPMEEFGCNLTALMELDADDFNRPRHFTPARVLATCVKHDIGRLLDVIVGALESLRATYENRMKGQERGELYELLEDLVELVDVRVSEHGITAVRDRIRGTGINGIVRLNVLAKNELASGNPDNPCVAGQILQLLGFSLKQVVKGECR